jgi:hypothetical protein
MIEEWDMQSTQAAYDGIYPCSGGTIIAVGCSRDRAGTRREKRLDRARSQLISSNMA